jgi:4-aminobutyrate aminotransferase / (S)-3-amino-2-methylpropionate transaminase / 5-aminovalerate transaminase
VNGSGPRLEADAADRQFVPSSYLIHHPLVLASAEGAYAFDQTGRRFIDFAGGIGVVNVGHRAREVVAAIHAQADLLLHTGPVTLHQPYLELARRLALRLGPGRSRQTLFVNSGAEAVENAVKLARYASGRQAVIAFDRSFHGRTLLTSSLTGKARPYKGQPGAMAPEIYHAPYPYPLRPPPGVPRGVLIENSIGFLDQLVETQVPIEHVAAVIVEPVQGEGGYIVPPRGFLAALADWCRAHQVLLIVDEIQTGYGRTGRFFAFEHESIDPDIVTVGKSIADGLPLAAVIAGKELWDRVNPGDIGGTYGGNPLACAAGLAVLDIFEHEPLVERASQIGEQLMEGLAVLSEHPQVGEVRGLGAMLAVEFVQDRISLKPEPSAAQRVVEEARERGLLLIRTGVHSNAVRFLPPLIADADTVSDALEIFHDAVSAAMPAGRPA